MKRHLSLFIICIFLVLMALFTYANASNFSDFADGSFPQKNAWTQAIPSVVWAGDPASLTTLNVNIVKRSDVKRVWLTSLGSDEPEGRRELFDDGTHGDQKAGDRVFTLAEVLLPSNLANLDLNSGACEWWGFLRVETKDGKLLGNNFGMIIGMVDPKYKDAFPVKEFGKGLYATPYAFFIQDSKREVISNYPVSNVTCGTGNYNAYKKLYSIYPDAFDFASLMPGMQIFRPKDMAESVPYCIMVSNKVKNIGLPLMDNTKRFGSSGRLASVQYSSFGCVDIADHEIGHTWGMALGKKLGLLKEKGDVSLGHWNSLSDVSGQMGAFFFAGDKIGQFAYNGDGIWRLIPNTTVKPYSPLELYVMGLIPSSEIPDVHLLEDPDLSDPERITAESQKTFTAEEIVKSAGGERIPSAGESRKDFRLAFIVTQDLPYNDAAFAYFSLLSMKLADKGPPSGHSMLAPFHWATGGRATLDTFLGNLETKVPAK